MKAAGIALEAPVGEIPPYGELTPGVIAQAFGAEAASCHEVPDGIPPRPPALCPGCPHRLVFRELARMKAIVTGDIGCYTLGAMAPLSAIDTCVDMARRIPGSRVRARSRGVDHKARRCRYQRFHVRPFRNHLAAQYRLQLRCGRGMHPGQPHHRDDRPPGQSRERHYATASSAASSPARARLGVDDVRTASTHG